MSTVQSAIDAAESLLPGAEAAENELDPRWQAIITIGEFVESDPEPVWQFTRRWGIHADPDLRAAVATCLLEHLLEHHFALIFPRVAELARNDSTFADTFLRCWKFGQSLDTDHAFQFESLQRELS